MFFNLNNSFIIEPPLPLFVYGIYITTVLICVTDDFCPNTYYKYNPHHLTIVLYILYAGTFFFEIPFLFF